MDGFEKKCVKVYLTHFFIIRQEFLIKILDDIKSLLRKFVFCIILLPEMWIWHKPVSYVRNDRLLVN